jgi:hypothetical protein
MLKYSYEMTKEEREIHIQKLGKRKTYNKLNDKIKYIFKELKGYERV